MIFLCMFSYWIYSEVNHCLIFEQVSDEVIETYKIPQGNFDTITDCKYVIPGFMYIGQLYSIMIQDCAEPGKEISELIKIFNFFISDEITNFKTRVYYQNPDYLECSCREGYLLEWKECVLLLYINFTD